MSYTVLRCERFLGQARERLKRAREDYVRARRCFDSGGQPESYRPGLEEATQAYCEALQQMTAARLQLREAKRIATWNDTQAGITRLPLMSSVKMGRQP